MTAGALSCTVLVEGVRVADGSPGDDPAAPMVLDDLGVTWGRSTTLDQPEAASATMLIRNTGPATFPGLLATGRRLDVRTDATVYPDPTVPTVTDPSFTAGGPGRITDNATLTVGGGVALLDPGPNRARRARVVFAPDAFQPAGTNPAAWDTIPKTAAGQTWRYGATVTLPTALAAVTAGQLHPVTFTGPWATTARVLEAVTLAPGPGPVSALFEPPPGVWLGLCVDVYPPGPAWDQVDPALTWDLLDPALTWDQLAQTRIDDLVVLAPAAGTTRSALVFSGRITDLAATRDGDATLVALTAQDHTAELANRDVADVPWSVETLGVRAQRVVTLSGQATTITVDAGPAAVAVTRRDVDAQPALGLLQELATTADGVLWSATHLITGQYLHLEDTHARVPLMLLTDQGGTVVIVPDPDPAKATKLSACTVLADRVEWVQDTSDVATRVAVSWQEQTTPPADLIEHTETVTDPYLLDRLGVRRIGITSQLTTAPAANTLAAAVLARTTDLGWRITALTWDTALAPLDPAEVAAAFTLLDGTTRLGAPLLVTDLPAWSPSGAGTAALFCEGGRYAYTGGDWVLELTVSSATSQGAAPTWDQLNPAWGWDQFDPAITWDDLTGVRPL